MAQHSLGRPCESVAFDGPGWGGKRQDRPVILKESLGGQPAGSDEFGTPVATSVQEHGSEYPKLSISPR